MFCSANCGLRNQLDVLRALQWQVFASLVGLYLHAVQAPYVQWRREGLWRPGKMFVLPALLSEVPAD